MASETSERAMSTLLDTASQAAADALEQHRSGGPDTAAMREKGERPGQYRLDLVVDEAVLPVLDEAGVGVLSEESGLSRGDSDVVVVVDPVDGSTNASRGIPWYACSLCAVDRDGPWVALVVNLATGTRHTAVRGKGAWCDGEPIATASTTDMADSLVVLNGIAPYLGWRQYRSLGATALDICAVADGSVDATIDCTFDALGPWDYMGAMLVLTEAGGHIADVKGRDLVTFDPEARRTPVSACTAELHEVAMAARKVD